MNFTTQLKTWAAGIGLAASIMNSTPIHAQGVDEFDTIGLDAPTPIHNTDLTSGMTGITTPLAKALTIIQNG